MKAMIRLPGLIAFVAVVVVLFVSVYFLAAPIIGGTIERLGTAVNGARVDVDDVSLTFNPFGLVVGRIQVTDAEAPMTNLVDVKGIRANVQGFKFLLGHMIVDDLSINSLAFETPRRISGATKSSETLDGENDKSLGDKFDAFKGSAKDKLPDADDLLEREPLLVVSRKETLVKNYETRKAGWEALKKTLPTKDALATYKKEIQGITSGKITSLEDFNARKERLSDVKKSIKRDRQALSDAREYLSESQKILKTDLDALREAPKEDWQKLRDKYGMDQAGMVNATGLLFGPEYADKLEKALGLYRKIQPFLSSGDDAETDEYSGEPAILSPGRFIHFASDNPLPSHLIREAKIFVSLSTGDLAVQINDITDEQHIMGIPTTLTIDSTALSNVEHLKVKGLFDHRAALASDVLDFTLSGMQIRDKSLSESESLTVSMPSASLTATGRVGVEGGVVRGDINNQFSQVALRAEGDSSMAKEFSELLSGILDFNIVASVSGSLDDIDVGIKSNLDRRLSDAFKTRLKSKQQEWEAKIKAGLQEKLTDYLQSNEKLAAFFGNENGIVDTQISDLDDLAKQKLSTLAEQEKQEAKAKIDAEKAELKQKAEEKKEKKKQEFEDKMKGKLKGLF